MMEQNLQKDTGNHGDSVLQAVRGGKGAPVKSGQRQKRQHNGSLGQQRF